VTFLAFIALNTSSDPVPAEVLEKRLLKLKELGTFGISLTGGDARYS
jgi:hypothetical protein